MDDTLTDSELNNLKRAAMMVSTFLNELIAGEFTNYELTRDVVVRATPELIRRAFDGRD